MPGDEAVDVVRAGRTQRRQSSAYENVHSTSSLRRAAGAAIERIRGLVVGLGQHEADPDAALARELGEPRQERRRDPAPLMALGDVDLVDEEVRPVAMPPRQLVGEHEADRPITVERDEHQRPRIGEQPLGIARPVVRRELTHDVLVARPEQANRDSGHVRSLFVHCKEDRMPGKRPTVKNEKQYEKLKEKGMSKERAAKIANSPGASKPRRQSVALRHFSEQLEPGRHDRPEEGRGPQGRTRDRAQELDPIGGSNSDDDCATYRVLRRERIAQQPKGSSSCQRG